MSKIRTVLLSYIISEIFIIIIELAFEIPLNAYHYLDLNLTEPGESNFPFLPGSEEHADLSRSPLFMKNITGSLLWLLTSPALLIAVVVYILAPEDEIRPAVNSHI